MYLVRRMIGMTVVAGLLFLNALAAGPSKVDTNKVAIGKASPPVAASDTLVVIARVVEIPGKFAPNDLYDYVYIMKYRVLKVEKGRVDAPELLIGHYNPLIARAKIVDKMDPLVNGNVERFVVGAKHRLTLITPIERVWNGAIEDEYIDVDSDKYYAIRADVLP